jgi:RHS repeat-associated protein
MQASTEFLYTGSNPVQTGVAGGVIAPDRVAVARGRVLAIDGTALPSVTVTVLGHPELGQTVTRADGRYDMAMNAGERLTLRFVRPGFLPSERAVDPPVRDFAAVNDVALVPYDAAVAAIEQGAATAQVAQGTSHTDSSGARRTTLIFTPGTRGTMRLADGSTRALGTMHVRVTEYTVGAMGPERMPGDLPPTSAYTHAVDYSVDEAVLAGATGVSFDQPVIAYTENFLHFPVGGVVPLGSYDSTTGHWVPSDNGRVVKILSIANGIAALDVDGSGNPATAAQLQALAITDPELGQLATLFTAGTELWRAPVTHFSGYDHNWPYGPCDGCSPPPPPPSGGGCAGACGKDPRDPCNKNTGSFVVCATRGLHEDIALTGTPYRLHYSSERSATRVAAARSVPILLSGSSVPAALRGIELTVDIAGEHIERSFPPDPNQSTTFAWDGRDGYGRVVTGQRTASITIAYTSQAVYLTPAALDRAFERYPLIGIGHIMNTRALIRLTQTYAVDLDGGPTRSDGLGGWALDVHHGYDPRGQVAALGNGDTIGIPAIGLISNLVCAVPACTTGPHGAAVAADGGLYFADLNPSYSGALRVMRRRLDGSVDKVADLPSPPSGLTTIPLAEAPGGGVYAAPVGNSSPAWNGPVYRVDADGTVHQLTGGSPGTSQNPTPGGGDGLPASQVVLANPKTIATGPDGSLYIADGGYFSGQLHPYMIQRIGRDGILTTVKDIGNLIPLSIAVGPDGIIYVGGLRSGNSGGYTIERIGLDGRMAVVAGNGAAPCCQSGQEASLARIDRMGLGMAVTRTGSLLFNAYNGVWALDHLMLERVLGDGSGPNGDTRSGVPAETIGQLLIDGIAVGAYGKIYVTSQEGIRTAELALPGFALTDYRVPSRDGRQVYLFDGSGRHLRTVDALTGTTLLTFGYDSSGRLSRAEDRYGLATTIERDGAGNPTAIVAPNGDRTTLALDGDGNLKTATAPGGLTTSLTYAAGGLLTGETDASGGAHAFAYDASGKVTRDQDADGVATAVSGDKPAGGGDRVTLTSPLGRTLSYFDNSPAGGTLGRTSTAATGAVTTSQIKPDGTRNTAFPDGHSVRVAMGPDPRFGMLAPIETSAVLNEPSGLQVTIATQRSTTLADPLNAFTVTKQTDATTAGQSSVTTTYDAGAHTVTTASSTGRRVIETIDSHLRTTRLDLDPAIDPVALSYDARGRLTQTAAGARQHTYAYDAHDRATSVTNALGQATRYGYDASGRLTSTTLPGGEVYGFGLDGLGRPTGVAMPNGAVHGLSLTAAGRFAGYQPPGGGPGYVTAYDADGAPRSTTMPSGRVETLTHDSGGRLATLGFPEATVTAGFAGKTDRVASLTRAPAGGGTASTLGFGYEGDLVTSLDFGGPAAGGYTYAYDSSFEPTAIGLAAAGTSVTTALAHDGGGLLTKQGDYTFARGGPLGGVSAITGGPLSVTQSWDRAGTISARTDLVNNVEAYHLDLTRDNAGRMTRKVERTAGASHTYDYTYDANGRLLTVSRDGVASESYAYDPNGNRTTRQIAAVARTATYDVADRITALGATTYQLDADGFLAQRGADTFSYSTRGELLSATVAGQTQTYAYDSFGRMVARTDPGGGVWRYLYGNLDRQTQVTAVIDPAGTLTTLDYTDAGVLFSILRGNTRYYVSSDQAGSPRVVTDANGVLVKQVDYSAYGEVLSDTNPAFVLPIGYGSGVKDPLTGLVRMGGRDYDPAAGRFTARDPLLYGGQQANLYEYADGDPIQRSDPTGFLSGGGSACVDGGCGGGKFAWTDKGISVCVEIGVGWGNSFDINPFGALDKDGAYIKAQAELAVGPFASTQLTGELGLDGCLKKPEVQSCLLGNCINNNQEGKPVDSNDFKVKPDKIRDIVKGLKGKVGLEASAVGGYCTSAKW